MRLVVERAAIRFDLDSTIFYALVCRINNFAPANAKPDYAINAWGPSPGYVSGQERRSIRSPLPK
jgi:hypothetical protein